jgi:hypothetical protein
MGGFSEFQTPICLRHLFRAAATRRGAGLEVEESASIDSGLARAYPMSMTAPAITFDRLAYIDRLKEAGFDDKQARAQADALDAALRDSVATRADLEELAGELRTEMANLKVDILRWLVVTQIALGGVILAAVKFVK